MEKELSVLTEKQRMAYTLRERHLTYRQIAEAMGVTASCAAQHVRHAERRLREYAAYCGARERNQERVFFPLTRGELRLIQSGLDLLARELRRGTPMRSGSDYLGRLSCDARTVAELIERARRTLYGGDDPPLY